MNFQTALVQLPLVRESARQRVRTPEDVYRVCSDIAALVAVVSMLLFCSGCGRESRIVEYGDGKYGVQTWQLAGWHDVGRVTYPTLERAQEVKRAIDCEDVKVSRVSDPARTAGGLKPRKPREPREPREPRKPRKPREPREPREPR